MATPIVLVSRGVWRVTLVAQVQHEFLDQAGNFVGRRVTPPRGQTQAVVNARQNVPYDLTTDLINPDGSKFDLTGATTIRVSVITTTPLKVTLTTVAGSATGAPADGRVLFTVPSLDFVGYAEGEVEVVKSGRTWAFDKVPFSFDERNST